MRDSITPLEAALHELEYVVVDVETTGNSAYGLDRVTEVGAVVVRGGRAAESFGSLVNPGRPIPPFIVGLTGITNTMVANAPSFAEIAGPLAEFMKGRIFVAHNADFDWKFVRAELARVTGAEPTADRLCTVRLARRLLSHLHRRNLDAVSAHYEISITSRHRALGDATATAHVLTRMLHDLGQRGIHTWGDLGEFFAPRKRRRPSALPQPATDLGIA